MSQFQIYKASAGSGKTFRLALEYIKLAMADENGYRRILAVTFTKKATAEMKSRIVEELYGLSEGRASAYLDVLVEELGWTPELVRARAKQVLKHILHDYSRFSISTIDSFFQKVIRAFNRELGINTSFVVEFDSKGLLEEAAGRLVQTIDDDPDLLQWFRAFATDNMQEGRGWNLKKDVIKLGDEINKEIFKSFADSMYEKFSDRKFLKEYRRKMVEIISVYENKLVSIGKEGLDILTREGLTVDDFRLKDRGPASAFRRLASKMYDLSDSIASSAADVDQWVVKSIKEPRRSQLCSVAENQLMPKLSEAIDFMADKGVYYRTAKLIVTQLYSLGVLVDLGKMLRNICKEKGVVQISDSTHLLKKVISGSDAPFVYEKTGSVYSHFMIDEFQDTSAMQWDNFRPLIANSLSDGNLGMVVGDVKQAIYRWRGGDWRLLGGAVESSFPASGTKYHSIESNWRSYGAVVKFNNTVFSSVPKLLQQHYGAGLTEAGIEVNPMDITIPEVYANSSQTVARKEFADKGYVRVKFVETSELKPQQVQELIVDELLAKVKTLQDKGVKAGEMAILVRSKSEGRIVADMFIEQKKLSENSNYNFDILSDESLYVGNSESVRLIVAILSVFLNPDDQVQRALVNYLYYLKICPRLKEIGETPAFIDDTDMSLANQFEGLKGEARGLLQFIDSESFFGLVAGKPVLEMVYGISEKLGLFLLSGDQAYLQAFIDRISLYERNNAPELTNFLDWWTDSESDERKRFAIPVSGSTDAISLMTIHKSKGLEFDHVFIPFFKWDINPHTAFGSAPLLWCKPTGAGFDTMELVPVRFGKNLGRSLFYREFFAENFYSYIDNLNLMYVALTRAKAGLYVWAPFVEGKTKTVGDVLRRAVVEYNSLDDSGLSANMGVSFNQVFNRENNLLEIGNSEFHAPKTECTPTAGDVVLPSFKFTDFRGFMHIKKHGKDYFDSENANKSLIEKGNLIHEILSLVVNADDLERAVRRVEMDGKMEAEEAEQMLNILTEAINGPEVQTWFDGTYKVLNERNILCGDNITKRPDRIMFGNNETVVVDYKSGDAELQQHKHQVQNYIDQLKSCGFQRVTGYVWYLKSNKRVKVGA